MKNRIQNLNLLPVEAGEFSFSFTHALASSLRAMGCTLDRKVLTGASGFAFRIFVEVKSQCPSAMSVFDFKVLPRMAVELCGYTCTHITRLWDEEGVEAERRVEAHEAIRTAVNEGRPPVVWDIGIPEWGLIAGYDDEAEIYETIDCKGQRGAMPYAQLGKREIPILSVTIPGKPTGESLADLAPRTISAAVCHAHGWEWNARPAYESGLEAYSKWAALIRKVDQTGFSSRYYAGIYAHLRDCAAVYVHELAQSDDRLLPAAKAYARVAAHLKEAHDAREAADFPTPELLAHMEQAVLEAYEQEKQAVRLLENRWRE